MQSIDRKIFQGVAAVHAALLFVFLSWGCVSRWFVPKPTVLVPVEFIVDVTPVAANVSEPTVTESVPESLPDQIPEPVPQKKPQERPAIEVSRKRVVRNVDAPVSRPNPLTEAEIRKLLAEGADPGDRTSIPDEDTRALALIKTALDALWQKPSKAAAGDAETFLRLWIESDGRIGKTELSRRSGSPDLDASVEAVAGKVRHIYGLSSDFISRRSPVTVSFTVQ